MLVWGKVFKSEAKIAYLGNKRKHITIQLNFAEKL